jgi:hypothetical protein
MSMRTLPLWLAAVWAMSLTTLGFFVVPMLFVHLPTPAMAGAMAAKLASGMLLLAIFRSNKPIAPVEPAQAATLFVVSGVLLALLVEFAVAPHIIARDNLALWHRVGSAMYFAQWVCALVVFGKVVGATGTD